MWRNALEPWHIIVVLLVIFLLFGANKMPDMARSLGRSMRIFKSEVDEMRADNPASGNHPANSSASGTSTRPTETNGATAATPAEPQDRVD